MIWLYIPGVFHKASWRKLQEESCAIRERGIAKGTWANRVSNLRAYLSFTTYFGVPDFPVHLSVILRFIALLGRSHIVYKYASDIISSIKWFARLLDPPSVKIFDTVLVSVSLKGLKAQLSRPVRQKLPFTLEHLCSFYDCLDLSNVKHLAAWCAMLLAFFGCFRLSNLVPVSKNKFDPLKHLRRSDIKFDKDVVLVFYKWSKTNQNSNKVSWVPLCLIKDERFNLKCFLNKLFSIVRAPDDSPLFSFSKKAHHSRYSLVRLLNTCVYNANLDLSDYSWHSFRRGAAVFAFELGLADSAVQLLGDWSSAAFKNYLEFSFLKKISVAREIAKNFEYQIQQL